jgi:hypothetical protein
MKHNTKGTAVARNNVNPTIPRTSAVIRPTKETTDNTINNTNNDFMKLRHIT